LYARYVTCVEIGMALECLGDPMPGVSGAAMVREISF
jgi:hypothetical protein